MKPIAAALIAAAAMISIAQADERLDAYEACWADTAVSTLTAAGTETEASVMQAIEAANTTCNKLARHAAETNGTETVNETWRYMEVQFANANLREADTTASISQGDPVDFKGFVIGQRYTAEQIDDRLSQDGPGTDAPITTIGGTRVEYSFELASDGTLRSLQLRVGGMAINTAVHALKDHYGEPDFKGELTETQKWLHLDPDEIIWHRGGTVIYVARKEGTVPTVTYMMEDLLAEARIKHQNQRGDL